jgi:hypothetical protein
MVTSDKTRKLTDVYILEVGQSICRMVKFILCADKAQYRHMPPFYRLKRKIVFIFSFSDNLKDIIDHVLLIIVQR